MSVRELSQDEEQFHTLHTPMHCYISCALFSLNCVWFYMLVNSDGSPPSVPDHSCKWRIPEWSGTLNKKPAAMWLKSDLLWVIYGEDPSRLLCWGWESCSVSRRALNQVLLHSRGSADSMMQLRVFQHTHTHNSMWKML